MSREVNLSSNNCMTIIRSITVGSKSLNATYKNRKGRKRVILVFGDIPDNWTKKQLDDYLKDVRVFLPDNFIEYPASGGRNENPDT